MSCEALVSVIIPTYNRAHLLDRAICSVFEQSYFNFEILVVDDHSTDGTEQRIRDIEEIDSRIRYLRNSLTQGISNTRNAGLDDAKGEYIAFLDSDDLWEPHHLEWAVACFNKAPEATFYFGNRVQFDLNSGETLGMPFPGASLLEEVDACDLGDRYWQLGREFHELLYTGNPMAICSVVLRRDTLGDTRFDANLVAAEDRDFWLRVLLSKRQVVIFHNEVVARISRHDGNMSSNTPSLQLCILRSHQLIFRKLLSHPDLTERQCSIIARQRKSELGLLPHFYRQNNQYSKAFWAAIHNADEFGFFVTSLELMKTLLTSVRAAIISLVRVAGYGPTKPVR